MKQGHHIVCNTRDPHILQFCNSLSLLFRDYYKTLILWIPWHFMIFLFFFEKWFFSAINSIYILLLAEHNSWFVFISSMVLCLTINLKYIPWIFLKKIKNCDANLLKKWTFGNVWTQSSEFMILTFYDFHTELRITKCGDPLARTHCIT